MMNTFAKIFFIFFFIDIVQETFSTVISDCKQNIVGKGNLFTYGEFCLRIVSNHRSWNDARKGCAKRGGDLLQIRESSMQQSLVRELTRLHLKDSKFWIGATDKDREGQWKWVSGDATMTYNNWNPGQGPNQRGFLFFSGSLEDCALLDAHDNFRWHDYFCRGGPAFHYSFICQYKMRTVQTSTEAVQTTEIKGNVVDPNRYTTIRGSSTLVAFTSSTKVQPTTWTKLLSSSLWPFPLSSLSSSSSSSSSLSSSLTSSVWHSTSKEKLTPRVDRTSTVTNIPTKLFQTRKINKGSSTSSSEVSRKQESPIFTKYVPSPSIIISTSQQRRTQKLVNDTKQSHLLTRHSSTSKGTTAQTNTNLKNTNSTAHVQEPGFLVKHDGESKSQKGAVTAGAVVCGCIVVIIAVAVIVVILRRKASHKGEAVQHNGMENPMYGLRNDSQADCLTDKSGESTCNVHINDIYSSSPKYTEYPESHS